MKSDVKNNVENLVDIFKGLTPDKINNVVSLAKEQRIKKNELDALFDAQVRVLGTRGCPERVMELFKQAQTRVVTKALKMEIEKNHIPFLPVITRNYITVFSQMRMVLNKNVAGRNSIYRDNATPANPFRDLVKIPKEPYYIFNVENGTSTKNGGPNKDEIKEQVAKHGYVCLTGIEIIALAVHSDVLSKHNILGMNSFCNEWGVAVPYLFISTTGQPVLRYTYNLSNCDEEYGIPSRDCDVMI
ncbi:hypothetical protein KKH38_00555 [Patescibacteria group bacterium]|nr:hypothetical protein [Patescibacteria group bacterium]MBU4600502.1 hypothetical protein [Patescibacteria group bacterium]MCG2697648.1 hypothetical protein [Candidatus Parcubacteria bacterium]